LKFITNSQMNEFLEDLIDDIGESLVRKGTVKEARLKDKQFRKRLRKSIIRAICSMKH
jgi:hypothetical protein